MLVVEVPSACQFWPFKLAAPSIHILTRGRHVAIADRLDSDTPPGDDTLALVGRIAAGDAAAVDLLLTRHRARLRHMVKVRLDDRIAARVDPSDVVQEALFDAARRLPDYALAPPLPFYPWLRQIAWDRLADLHKRHLRVQKRSVRREEPLLALSDRSAIELARRLIDPRPGPTGRLLRREQRQRVQAAVARLDAADREILVLRHLEQMPVAEIAALMNISEGAVKMRRLRAVERLRALLDEPNEDSPP
jgi:RNA polymerase sigma-70 factor (ECF subfamily)